MLLDLIGGLPCVCFGFKVIFSRLNLVLCGLLNPLVSTIALGERSTAILIHAGVPFCFFVSSLSEICFGCVYRLVGAGKIKAGLIRRCFLRGAWIGALRTAGRDRDDQECRCHPENAPESHGRDPRAQHRACGASVSCWRSAQNLRNLRAGRGPPANARHKALLIRTPHRGLPRENGSGGASGGHGGPGGRTREVFLEMSPTYLDIIAEAAAQLNRVPEV
jgi:hypothetical protein